MRQVNACSFLGKESQSGRIVFMRKKEGSHVSKLGTAWVEPAMTLVSNFKFCCSRVLNWDIIQFGVYVYMIFWTAFWEVDYRKPRV